MTPESNSLVLSVVVPLFNEQETVEELISRLEASCCQVGASYELLVVNDGSSDRTLELLIGLSQTIPSVRVINLSRNFGHMAALSAGLSLARGQGVVVMDGDLQDPPELIPQLYAQWKNGADVVFGLRTRRYETFFQKKATILFYWLLQKITDVPIPRQGGTFCFMDRCVVNLLMSMPERDRYFAGLRAWAGGKQVSVPYERPVRLRGKSRVGMRGLFHLARTALISFSKVPLRYASFLSLLCGLVLFLVGVVAIGIRLFTNLAIPGWATSTALIGMMGFVQSIVLAVISEYVAVIFDEIKGRPLFIVREEFVRGERVT